MLQSGPRGFPEDKTVSEELATGKAISFKDSHVWGSGGGWGVQTLGCRDIRQRQWTVAAPLEY